MATTTLHPFRHTHTSSRFSRSAASLLNALRKYDRSALITVTEVSAERREKAIRQFAEEEGYGFILGDKSGMDDTSILWDETRFKVLKAWTELLKGGRYSPLNNGRLTNTGVSFALLLDLVTNRTILVTVCHLPASVEGGGRFKRGTRRTAWLQVRKAWGARRNYWAKHYNAQAVIQCADWNVNIRLRFFRAFFKSVQPTMRLVINRKTLKTRKGTLGNRIIDFTFIRGRIKVTKAAWTLPHDESSDHTAYAEELSTY